MRFWSYVDADYDLLGDEKASELVDRRAWTTPEAAVAAAEADLRERFDGCPYEEGGLPDSLEWTEDRNMKPNPAWVAELGDQPRYVDDGHPDRVLSLQDGALTVVVYPIDVDLGADGELLRLLLAQVALDEPEHWGTTAEAARALLERLA